VAMSPTSEPISTSRTPGRRLALGAWRRIALAALTAFAALSAVPAAAATRDWTVIIYMNGKNSLEGDALNNFHAMASVGSTDRVAYVAELGRPKVHHDTSDGGWSGVYRFYIAQNQSPLPAQAVEPVDPAGQDMGKPATLHDFIAWAKAKYPAQHYMVIIWNHGQGYRLQMQLLAQRVGGGHARPPVPIGGVRAVSSDDDTGSILYNSDVEASIASNFTGPKLDLLGFDACLMEMIETAYAMAPSTSMMVASEDLEPGDGWQYAHWMDKLAANPSLSSADLSRAVIAAYKADYGNEYMTTLSAIDLSKIRPVSDDLSALADAIRKAGPTEIQALGHARGDLLSYGQWFTPPFYTSVDLIGLLARYEQLSHNQTLIGQSAAFRAELAAQLVDNYASSRSTGLPPGSYVSAGIAIYYPTSKATFRADPYHSGYLKTNTDRPIAFVQNEHWADLLYAELGLH
jgi:Clostripain family